MYSLIYYITCEVDDKMYIKNENSSYKNYQVVIENRRMVPDEQYPFGESSRQSIVQVA